MILDHIIIAKEPDFSFNNEHTLLPIKDIASSYQDAYAALSKDEDNTNFNFRDFLGGLQAKRIFIDSANELHAIAKQEGLLHNQATPYRKQSHGLPEALVHDVLDGTRTVCAVSGAPLRTWPFAARCYCLHKNCTVLDDGTTAWKNWTGSDFTGTLYPYCAAIKFRPPGDRGEVIPVGKFAANLVDGYFLGYKLQPGSEFKNEYICISEDDMLALLDAVLP